MRLIITLLFAMAFSFPLTGQPNLTEQARPIIEEGKRLYKLEMASWYGTDLFLEQFKKVENIGGYFSYTLNDTTTCIFFSNKDAPVVIGSVAFDSTFDVHTARVQVRERAFTKNETALFEIRQKTLQAIQQDTLFKIYKNTNLNLIPLIHNNEKKVYILTGPQESGVVILGNDYLVTFNKKNEITHKKALHNNIIPVYYGEKDENGNEMVGAVHSHLPESGDYITATDICTLMMYQQFTHWKTHTVVSAKYLNFWDCRQNTLVVVPVDIADGVDKDQEKVEKKQKKKGKN